MKKIISLIFAVVVLNIQVSASADFSNVITATPDSVTSIVESVRAGDILLLEKGVYQDVVLNITASGTPESPIVIKSETDGVAEFTGKSTINISGSYVVVSGIFFNNCIFNDGVSNVVSFSKCENSRLTNCYFYRCGSSISPYMSMIYLGVQAKNCRVDNNLIEDARAMSVVVSATTTQVQEDAATDNRIDHNYFLNIKRVNDVFPGMTNGFECIQTGQAIREDVSLGTIIEYNRFENVIGDGSEIISNKSNGNIYKCNTFVDCPSQICLRAGNGCIFSENYLINVDKGMRFYGKNHKITDNYFYRSGSLYIDATMYAKDGAYAQQSACRVTSNIIIEPLSAAFVQGRYYNTLDSRTVLPEVSVSKNFIYLNNARAVIDYVGCKNIVYEDNTVTLCGASAIGDCSQGFEADNKRIVYDGEINIPEDTELKKEGLILLNKLNGWWRSSLSSNKDNVLKNNNEKKLVSYLPQSNQSYFCSGEEKDIRAFAGTAYYQDGTSEKINADEVSFLVQLPYAVLKNNSLKLKNNENTYKTADIISVYKGKQVLSKLYIHPEAQKNTSTGDLYCENDVIPLTKYSGSLTQWNVYDGKLEVADGVSNTGVILADYFHKSGDFEFSCDITINQYEDFNPYVRIVFGYNDFIYGTKEYKINICDNGGIYSTDSNTRLSELSGAFNAGKMQKFKLVKRGNIVSASIDGNLISVAEIDKDMSGKFGFYVENTLIKIENIDIFEKTYDEVIPENISMSYKRVDEETIVLSFDALGDNYLYKFYKNGIYMGDLNPGEDIMDTSVYMNTDFAYTIRAYDINGAECAAGELTLNLSPPSDNEMFRITDVMSRSGMNGEYISSYIAKNRFLDVGSYAYNDRIYAYSQVDESFKDSGCILTSYDDRNNTVFMSEPSDWVTFNINRSATIYILLNTHIIPGWLNDWTREEDSYFEINGNIQTSYIYSKHFETADGIKKCIMLGGFKGGLSANYQIIVKPDVMPAPINNIGRIFK